MPQSDPTKKKPKVKKGEAGPEQLPQGGAKQVNEDMPEHVPPPNLQTAEPETGGVPLDGDDDAIYGATDRPSENLITGVRSSQNGPPPNVGEWLPSLQEAAADPSAPPQLRQLLQLILYNMQGRKV